MNHLIVLYSTNFPVEPKNRKQSFISRNKRKFDAKKFSLDLSNQDWSNLYQCEDGNNMYNAFINVFSTTLEFHAPLIKSFQPERKIAERTWLTKELREEIGKKHRLFDIWKNNPSEQVHTIFKYQRNLVNRRLKTAQNEFCKQFFKELLVKNNGVSSKKRIGKERECLVIDQLVDGEIEVENELDIANCLNRSFQKLGLYNGQYVSAPNISRIEVREKFCFRTFTLKKLYDAIDSLDHNKSPGSGVFNAWAIKAATLPIGAHLQFVFNTCISQNVFPENLEIAFISPVYKKGDVKICENYRPISITPMFAKLFERLLLNQVNKFIQNEKILNGTQFGFQTHKSSTDAVLHLIEALQENYDNLTISVAVFFYLAKAFYSISNKIFLKKIEAYGFSESAVEFFASFLKNRQQCIRINDVYSEGLETNHGASQGTVFWATSFSSLY